jgi:hypothetical protein
MLKKLMMRMMMIMMSEDDDEKTHLDSKHDDADNAWSLS